MCSERQVVLRSIDLLIPPLYGFPSDHRHLVGLPLSFMAYFDLSWFEAYSQSYHGLSNLLRLVNY